MALVTNTRRALTERALEHRRALLRGQRVRRRGGALRKARPDPYRRAAALLGLDPRTAWRSGLGNRCEVGRGRRMPGPGGAQ